MEPEKKVEVETKSVNPSVTPNQAKPAEVKTESSTQSTGFRPRFGGNRGGFGDRSRTPGGAPGGSPSAGGSRFPRRDRNDRRTPGGAPGGRKRFGDNRKKQELSDVNIESQVLEVRRVSRTVKGGKKMRFSALVVAGDKSGKVGYGLSKGLDFQDAVSKATKKAKDTLIKVNINESGSLNFPTFSKYKSAYIYLKPAQSGTGLIAGGFLRPVLQLAGVQNIYSKIVGTNNKVVGVRATIEALRTSYLEKRPVIVTTVQPTATPA